MNIFCGVNVLGTERMIGGGRGSSVLGMQAPRDDITMSLSFLIRQHRCNCLVNCAV